jgi:hypothetical protein
MGKRGGRGIGLSQDLHISDLTVLTDWEDFCIFSQLSSLFLFFLPIRFQLLNLKFHCFFFSQKKEERIGCKTLLMAVWSHRRYTSGV